MGFLDKLFSSKEDNLINYLDKQWNKQEFKDDRLLYHNIKNQIEDQTITTRVEIDKIIETRKKGPILCP